MKIQIYTPIKTPFTYCDHSFLEETCVTLKLLDLQYHFIRWSSAWRRCRSCWATRRPCARWARGWPPSPWSSTRSSRWRHSTRKRPSKVSLDSKLELLCDCDFVNMLSRKYSYSKIVLVLTFYSNLEIFLYSSGKMPQGVSLSHCSCLRSINK